MLCPKCKTESAHRSHRDGLRERAASIVGYYPHRCRQCGHRFSTFRYSSSDTVAPAELHSEKEVAATRGSLRWKHHLREILLYGSALGLFALVLYFLTREPSIGN